MYVLLSKRFFSLDPPDFANTRQSRWHTVEQYRRSDGTEQSRSRHPPWGCQRHQCNQPQAAGIGERIGLRNHRSTSRQLESLSGSSSRNRLVRFPFSWFRATSLQSESSIKFSAVSLTFPNTFTKYDVKTNLCYCSECATVVASNVRYTKKAFKIYFYHFCTNRNTTKICWEWLIENEQVCTKLMKLNVL